MKTEICLDHATTSIPDAPSLPPLPLGSGKVGNTQLYQRLFETDEAKAVASPSPGYDQVYFKYTGLLEFLVVGGKINKATGI